MDSRCLPRETATGRCLRYREFFLPRPRRGPGTPEAGDARPWTSRRRPRRLADWIPLRYDCGVITLLVRNLVAIRSEFSVANQVAFGSFTA